MRIIFSIYKIPIRLTSERWEHIVENHTEMAGRLEEVLRTVQDPDLILQGNIDEWIAVLYIEKNKAIVVPYKETKIDGFIITAFLTSKLESLSKRSIIWQKQK